VRKAYGGSKEKSKKRINRGGPFKGERALHQHGGETELSAGRDGFFRKGSRREEVIIEPEGVPSFRRETFQWTKKKGREEDEGDPNEPEGRRNFT